MLRNCRWLMLGMAAGAFLTAGYDSESRLTFIGLALFVELCLYWRGQHESEKA